MPVSIGGSTGIGGNDGTVGTPAVRGSANNTGIYFPSAGNVAIAINGVQKLLIDNTGIITSNGATFIANTATSAGQIPFSTNGSTFTPTQKIVQGTSVATTSGTSIDFTGIPSWVKRVTVMLNNVSTNGSSIVQIQLGAGSVQTTGYKSTASYNSAAANQYAYATTGFVVDSSYATAALTLTGNYVFTYLGSNIWTGSGNIGGDASASISWSCAGGVTLSGTLDRVRITTVNGTDTFDAGSINILYE